jgi:hypothetical protein
MAMGIIQGSYFIWLPSLITSCWLPDHMECGRPDPPVPSLLQKGDTHTCTHVVVKLVSLLSQLQHHCNLRVCLSVPVCLCSVCKTAFLQEVLSEIQTPEIGPTLILCRDRVYFHLSDYLNSQHIGLQKIPC